MNEKTIQCLPNPLQHVPIYLQQFSSYSNRKCKKSPFLRTAAHIFVSPGDAPGAIILNVVWMEREFDANKLSRYMCPSNYNRFWDRARYWSKIVVFSYPLAFDAPVTGVPVGIAPPLLVWKNYRMAWLPESYRIYRTAPFSMTLSHPYLHFQGHAILWRWISQKRYDIQT